jgi:predicted negative regulator of RcsB-dependent stress response
LNNAAIAGEREAAEEATARHQEWIGAAQTPPAKSGKAALGEFDKAIAKTISIDYAALEDAVARSERDARDLSITAVVFAAIICLLAWVGLRPRLREYSA